VVKSKFKSAAKAVLAANRMATTTTKKQIDDERNGAKYVD